ncbi:MAG: hypothetical protein JXA68_04000 [Ignavibacteriales bacterium]|nr:hypothetical protein [Ignavibacteriales bacterium]
MKEFLTVNFVLLVIIILISSLFGGAMILLSRKLFLREKKINYLNAFFVCAMVFIVLIILWEYNESKYPPEAGILGAMFLNLVLSFLVTLPIAKYLLKTTIIETIKLCGIWVLLFSVFFSALYFSI